MAKQLRIGVLALQGNFREHAAVLRRARRRAIEVRQPEQLDGLDGLVVPGGESTAIGRLVRALRVRGAAARVRGAAARHVRRDDPARPTRRREAGGARSAADVVRRNAFGRQVRELRGRSRARRRREPLRGVFIRAPWIEEVGPGRRAAGRARGPPVLAREGRVLVAAFHPELTDDTRVHELFLQAGSGRRRMSGHSKWSSIKHKKGAADAKRGKLFSKLSRAIIVAAKEGGADPAATSRSRTRSRRRAPTPCRRTTSSARSRRAPARTRTRRASRRRLRGLRPRGRGGDRRGADRQPQPHRLRGAPPLREARRQPRRLRRGRVAVRAARPRARAGRGRRRGRAPARGGRGRRRRRLARRLEFQVSARAESLSAVRARARGSRVQGRVGRADDGPEDDGRGRRRERPRRRSCA